MVQTLQPTIPRVDVESAPCRSSKLKVSRVVIRHSNTKRVHQMLLPMVKGCESTRALVNLVFDGLNKAQLNSSQSEAYSTTVLAV